MKKLIKKIKGIKKIDLDDILYKMFAGSIGVLGISITVFLFLVQLGFVDITL